MGDSEIHAGQAGPEEELLTAIARAFGGAIFFSLPLLMTLEMWHLGFYIDRVRISLFLLLMVPVLIALSHFSGIRTNTSWIDDVADAFVAYAVAFAASLVVLYLFDIIDFASMPMRETIGKVSLQAVPASFGAMLANSQLGSSGEKGQKEKERKERGGYGTELFLMFTGALFLAFNVAPTEEMILIAFKMTHWHAIALIVVTLLVMHGFVYSADFQGAPSVAKGTPWWHLFLRFSVVGYAIALLTSAYVLWTFGRYEDHALSMYVMMATVLGFPAGLGAAAARLVL
jgi:putative integral membrane protein (TIGR02587 family)